MVSEVVQCAKSECDDAGIVNVNFFGDMIAEEDGINKEVLSVPPWQHCISNNFEVGLSKDCIIPDHPSHLWF